MVILRARLALTFLVVALTLNLAGPLTGGTPAAAAAQPGSVPAAGPQPAVVESFGLVSETAGWLVLDQRLYWTSDAGQTWAEKTPADLGPAVIGAAAFVDAARGWLVLVTPADAGPGFRLARTVDGGATWKSAPLALFAPGDPAALADQLYFEWLDAQTGWLVVKRATSRSFSVGTLFRTDDSGQTWTRLPLPIGAPVHFTTSLTGWVAGGAAGDERYETSDGGRTWQARPAGLDQPAAAGAATAVWASAAIGWTHTVAGECDPAAPRWEPACAAAAQLLQTRDGGQTWQPVPLPAGTPVEQPAAVAAPSAAPESPAAAQLAGGRTRPFKGQAMDACTLPSLTQMADWFTNSPYRVWNLYIGGIARGNCGTLTAAYIAELAAQGWRFIPTWVGPQAACSGFLRRMSLDPDQAFIEGAAEADLAVERAAVLGLTYADKTGSVIYYDLEAYDVANTACRAAAQAFIGGWSGRLRARGHLAGVYGATCTSALSDLAAISSVPDVIWAAYWLVPYQYRSTASVWNLPCLANTLWVNSQRIRQYSGGHTETWAGTSLNIDSSVVDGIVADLRYDAQPPVNPVELYLEPDYGGPDVCFLTVAGWLNASGCAPSWENQISALKLQANWSVRLYRDVNRGGPSVCYVVSDPDLSNEFFDATTPVDGQVSSLQVYANADCLEPPSPLIIYLPIVRGS